MNKFAPLFVALLLSAPNADGCEKPYSPEWDKAVVEILKFDANDSAFKNHGTGFLVKTYDPAKPQVLISNRHILADRSDLWVRVNLSHTGIKNVDTVPLEGTYSLRSRVIYPTDSNLDLAALPMPRIHTNWDIRVHSKSMFGDTSDIMRGTQIWYLGFPGDISLGARSVPVYRDGAIALDEDLISGQYLIDGTVIGGSSGSPVFTCDGRLVGVLCGHWNYGTINSGIGRMIPVNQLVELMNEISPSWSAR